MRAALAALLALAAGADPPRVKLERPRGGWTSQRVVAIAGTVSDRSVRRVQLTLNGRNHIANARAGRFEGRLSVEPGVNALEVSAANAAGTGRDRATFFAHPPRTDLKIALTWDTPGTDLDLHVTEPGGEECYHGNRRTSAGGLLEVDDTDGWGPELYALPVAALGEYRLSVAYYDAGRAAKTEAQIEVVVREGSPHEERHLFQVTLTHEGELVEVGSFVVDRPIE